ncbi:integrase arm-type DNA-binding domain-containing protein [Halomonas meridiana]|nr:integrase arm-type DNA-binding domain-containing protein [Halomonas meridiana]
MVREEGGHGEGLSHHGVGGAETTGQLARECLAEAREKRTDIRRQLAQGIDPVEQKQSERRQQQYAAQNTFKVIALEWHASMVPRWKGKL